MATGSANIALNVTGNANQQLAKTQKSVDSLAKSFDSLKTSLAGAALAAYTVSVVKFADSMQDLSNASGIATNNIVGLSKTFQANGGNAEQARAALLKLSQTVAEAADGGKDAQLAFQKVGVTLSELGTLSEEQILAKTIEGLAQIGDASLRLKTAIDIMGKGAKGIDFVGVANGYKSASAEALKYNDAIKASAALNDKVEAAASRLQLAFLKAFEPIADAINKIPEEKLNKFIDDFAQMAVALTALAAASKGLEWVGRGLAFIAASTALVTGGFSSLYNTFGAIGSRFTGFIKDLKMGTSLFEAFGKTITVHATKTVPYLAAGIGMLTKGFLGWAGILWLVSDAIKLVTGQGLIGWMGTAYDKMKSILGLGGGDTNGGTTKAEDDAETKRHANRAASAKAMEENNKKLRETQAYYEAQAKQLEANTQQFKRQGDEIVNNLRAEIGYNNISTDTVEILKAQNEAYKRTSEEVQKLKDQKALLKPEEKSLIAIYDQQILKIQNIGQVQAQQATDAIKILQQQRVEQDKLNHSLDMFKLSQQSTEAGKQLTEELSLIGLYGDELAKQQIIINAQRDLRKQLMELSAEELKLEQDRTKLGEDNFNREMAQIAQKRDEYVSASQDKIKSDQTVANARKISERTDVQGAIGKRMEEIQRSIDPTVLAVQELDSVFGNMGKAIDNFVDTGKFAFSDFASSIIKDLLKIELKAAATKMFTSMGGLGGILGGIGSWLGGFFAEGGQPPIGKPSIVGENGPELFVPKSAGTIIPNGGKGGGGAGGNTYITNNISALDAKSVAQLFAENRKALFGTVELARKEVSYGVR